MTSSLSAANTATNASAMAKKPFRNPLGGATMSRKSVRGGRGREERERGEREREILTKLRIIRSMPPHIHHVMTPQHLML